MADTKISALTAATTLADTDELVLASAGASKKITGANLKASMPAGGGAELSYVQITANVTVNATTEASATTIVTAAAVTVSGSQKIMIVFSCPMTFMGSGTTTELDLYLYDGSSSIGILAAINPQTTGGAVVPIYLSRLLTPSSGSHTYSIRGSRNNADCIVGAGAGGAGVRMPTYIRITNA